MTFPVNLQLEIIYLAHNSPPETTIQTVSATPGLELPLVTLNCDLSDSKTIESPSVSFWDMSFQLSLKQVIENLGLSCNTGIWSVLFQDESCSSPGTY